MSEELRTVGPPLAVLVWFCRECSRVVQSTTGAAEHRIECTGELEPLPYYRIDDNEPTVRLVATALENADATQWSVPRLLAKVAIRALMRGAS